MKAFYVATIGLGTFVFVLSIINVSRGDAVVLNLACAAICGLGVLANIFYWGRIWNIKR